MPQCNECPLNSMEHASTEHSVNSYLLLVIQLNGEKIKLWFTLIQTTLYAILLSCTHHTLPNWSALSLFCLFVCLSVPVSLFPAVDAIVAACVYLCLLYSCWCSRPSRALGLPAREPAWPRLVKILPWSRNALFQTLVETTMHNAHHNAQWSSWNIENTIASKILTVVETTAHKVYHSMASKIQNQSPHQQWQLSARKSIQTNVQSIFSVSKISKEWTKTSLNSWLTTQSQYLAPKIKRNLPWN